MAGFPGEDETSFRRTVDLVQRCGAAYLHVFPFSPRPGTPAGHLKPRVPKEVARERVAELRRLSSQLRTQFYARFLGRTLTAVAESERDPACEPLLVRTDNYILVRVLPGGSQTEETVFPVILERISDAEVIGRHAKGSHITRDCRMSTLCLSCRNAQAGHRVT
jgi:threonylcarbamoyladenosine tRNA methylthiotransferase MtaB